MAGQILDLIGSSVTIVTSRSEDGTRLNGLAIAWLSQVSYNPPLVMISVGPERFTHDLIKTSGVFAISIMDESGMETARFFGSVSGRNTDKFKDYKYFTKQTGCPILNNATAYLDCKVVSSVTTGDHTVFIGEVLGSRKVKDTEPLIFKAADYF